MKLEDAALDLDGRAMTLGEVIALGLLSGRATAALAALGEGLASESYLESIGEEPDGAELTPRVNAWRNKLGLASAELTQAWLDAHGLELGDLVGHLSRKLSRERIGDRLADTKAPSLADVLPKLADELLFDGALEALTLDLALRAVVDPPTQAGVIERELRSLRAEVSDRPWFEPLSKLVDRTSIDRVLHIEASFRVADRTVCAPEAVAAELKKSGRRLIKVEYATASFADEGVALEVVASLRDDRQMWLEQLAHQLGVEPTRVERYVEDLTGTAVSIKLAVGQTGDVIGPDEDGGLFRVYEVLTRAEPSVKDPIILARLQDRLRKRAYAAAVERRVRMRSAGA